VEPFYQKVSFSFQTFFGKGSELKILPQAAKLLTQFPFCSCFREKRIFSEIFSQKILLPDFVKEN